MLAAIGLGSWNGTMALTLTAKGSRGCQQQRLRGDDTKGCKRGNQRRAEGPGRGGGRGRGGRSGAAGGK